MHKFKILAFAVAAVLSAGTQAATINADRYSFSYDEGFWAGVAFTNSGNTFTFSDLGYAATATAQRSGRTVGAYSDSFEAAVRITADAGYRIESITYGMVGSLALSTPNPSIQAASVHVNGGAGWYSGWVPSGETPQVGGSLIDTTFYSGAWGFDSSTGEAKNYDLNGVATFASNVTQGYGYVGTTGVVEVVGAGASASVTHDRTYFTVSVVPVPEPEAYAMMLAGLGLMGAVVARRRKIKPNR